MEILDYLAAAAGDPSRAMLDILTGEGGPITEILFVVNIAVFFMGVLVLVWAGIAGMAKTAASGQFLKPGAQVWLPIRLILGLGGLMPAYHGLTVAQVAVLGAATLGIGIANVSWQGAYSGLLTWGGDSTFSTPAAASQNEAARALLASLVCQAEVNRVNDEARESIGEQIAPGSVEQIFGKVRPDTSPLPWQNFTGVALVFGGIEGYPADLCGGVRLSEEDTPESEYFTSETVLNAHSTAMKAMAAKLQPVADALSREHKAPDPAALKAAQEQYRETVAKALGEAVRDTDDKFSSWISKGEGKSWIYAGASLAKIASINREIQAAAGLKVEAVPAAESEFVNAGAISFLSIVRDSQLKVEGATAPEKTSFSLKNPDLGVLFGRLLRENLAPVLDWLGGDEQDLLGGLTSLGHKLILGTMAAMAAVLLALAMASGATLGTLGGLAGAVFSVFVYIFCLPLFGAGLLFAYYLPFLPLIYWVLGVLTWLIIFVEALFGAPLWALSHLLDTEAEGLGQRTAHGYLFLLQLIFRPALMLGGLVAGWLILQFFGGFLRHSLSIFFGSGGAFSGASGLLGFVACLVMFAYLSWQICSKAFSLIHHLPSEVLAWVGGHASRVGGEEREVEGRATGVVAGVGRGGGRGAGGGKPPRPESPPSGLSEARRGSGGPSSLPPPR
ncbi:MAG: DotA/TraY family protein [Desulfurivibrionaceae bacterium]|nr:DotA/TraY family protein [Desulfurivibrionaceae bacterium]